jgi:hypothetical protein
MLAYVTMHLANHAAGLVSGAAVEDAMQYVVAVWSKMPPRPPLRHPLWTRALRAVAT